MLLVNFLMFNHKCLSLVDLLHCLHCVAGYNYVISANNHGWMLHAAVRSAKDRSIFDTVMTLLRGLLYYFYARSELELTGM